MVQGGGPAETLDKKSPSLNKVISEEKTTLQYQTLSGTHDSKRMRSNTKNWICEIL